MLSMLIRIIISLKYTICNKLQDHSRNVHSAHLLQNNILCLKSSNTPEYLSVYTF
jgi:hypothetical protein